MPGWHHLIRQFGNLIAFVPIASNMQSPLISIAQALKALGIVIRTIAFKQPRILPLDAALVGVIRQ
ncbi:hypothetical protein PSCICO_12230 [Pseudomonas cichorii]|nr:hypothetical protein PSCICO_12230 [Pseudomonas cichorii]